MSRVSFAIAVATVVVAASPSIAADMYGGNRTAPAYGGGYQDSGASPAASWNGAYAGGSLGYGWGNGGLNGNHIGVYGGVNANVGTNVVVGGEADVNMSGQRNATVEGGNLRENFSNWNGSVRGRVGVAIDRFMPYATAGIALADDTVKYAGSTDSTTRVGYVLGGGVEAKVVDKVSVKGELLRQGFSTNTHSVGGVDFHTAPNSTILRAGAAYHF